MRRLALVILCALQGLCGGFREQLEEQGVAVALIYGNDLMGNPVGGLSRGITNTGSLYGRLTWEVDEHLLFYGSAVYQSGTSLSNRRIGNAFLVQQLALMETLFLNELYGQLTLCDERITFKAGRLNMGNDFLQETYRYNYVSAAFNGNPAGISFNIPFYAYPIATWGAVLSLAPIPSWKWKGAVYNLNSRLFQNRFHGINFTFENTDGWLLIQELHYDPPTLLPGRFVAGLYYQTGSSTRRFDYGGYLMFNKMVLPFGDRCSSRGLIPWGALLLAPIDRNRMPLYLNLGLVVQGPDPCRPDDSINFALAHGQFTGRETSETLLELNYWWQVRPWLSLTPDVQYVINPFGLNTISNAFAVGVQVYISL